MALRRPPVWRLIALLVVGVPLLAWWIVKPIRVLAPDWVGMTCPTATLCVERPDQLEVATALYEEAAAFVAREVSPLQTSPRFVFCATVACAESFGLGARSAVTLGLFGTVVGPRAWKPYYLRHEMIHVLQGEQLGVVSLLFKPAWFVEGMAYGLSADPREPLAEPFQTERATFRNWWSAINHAQLWALARSL